MRSKTFMVLVLMFTVGGLDIPTCAPGDHCGPGSVGQPVALRNAGRDIPMCVPGGPCGPGNLS